MQYVDQRMQSARQLRIYGTGNVLVVLYKKKLKKRATTTARGREKEEGSTLDLRRSFFSSSVSERERMGE